MSDVATEFKPNLDKLRKLQSQASSIVIGGKGVPRRKKKIIHKTATTDDKKLQSTLKKLTVNAIQGIDEVNMFKESGEVLHFVNPKVQASLASNIFAISGHAETKQLTEMLPTIMQQLGAENVLNIKNLAKSLATNVEDLKSMDDDVPQLVENFDEASKNETTTVPVETSPVKNTQETTPAAVETSPAAVETAPAAVEAEPVAESN